MATTLKKHRANHVLTAARLRARPGEWDTVSTYPVRKTAEGLARKIRYAQDSFHVYGPAGTFEARTRLVEDGTTRLEARYIGGTPTLRVSKKAPIRGSADTLRVLGQIERGEIRCGPDAARAIAARHEDAYGHAWHSPADGSQPCIDRAHHLNGAS